ncbi:MAG: alpha/beta fold hydrolase [bacterium]
MSVGQIRQLKDFKIHTIISPDKNQILNSLILHGAGQSHSGRYETLRLKLAENGFGNIIFDYPGHGKSSHNITDSSLQIRTQTAQRFIDELPGNDLTIFSFSMSGQVALELLKNNPKCIQNLILFCPAIYSKEAFEINFGPEFSRVIRKLQSWKNHDLKLALENFQGKLLIVIGENDEVIPKEVVQTIYDLAVNANKREILELPNVPHLIGNWLNEKPENVDWMVRKVSEFVNG